MLLLLLLPLVVVVVVDLWVDLEVWEEGVVLVVGWGVGWSCGCCVAAGGLVFVEEEFERIFAFGAMRTMDGWTVDALIKSRIRTEEGRVLR